MTTTPEDACPMAEHTHGVNSEGYDALTHAIGMLRDRPEGWAIADEIERLRAALERVHQQADYYRAVAEGAESRLPKKGRRWGRLIVTWTRQAGGHPWVDKATTRDAEGNTYRAVAVRPSLHRRKALRDGGRALVIGWRRVGDHKLTPTCAYCPTRVPSLHRADIPEARLRSREFTTAMAALREALREHREAVRDDREDHDD